MVDTLRLLTQWQNDISPSDISIFCSFSQRPVEAAEFMFSQHLIQSEFDVSEGEEHFPFLAAALRAYGSGEWQWESLIRRLLRKIVDLHVLISAMYPCDFSGYFTPLDELFRFTKTPFEGEAAAARWLRVLSSEGYDVMAYLEEEQALHAAQMQLTRPSCCKWLESHAFELIGARSINLTP